MRALAAVLVFLTATEASTLAEEERVPLGENFGTAEVITIAVVSAADIASFLLTPTVTESRDPLIGEPWQWDRSVSEELFRGADAGHWLHGVPDVTGMVIAPAVTFGIYGLNGVAAYVGRPIWGRNSDHELLALIEAYAVTVGATQAAKLSIGRVRPEYELERVPVPAQPDREATLSFFSLHASSSFCLAAFVSRDVGDHFVTRGVDPALARLVPSVVLYGAAGAIALSRIIDQKHYLTDVGLGAIVGAGVGNLFYAVHFDGLGQPRRRHRRSVDLVAFPGGIGLSGRF